MYFNILQVNTSLSQFEIFGNHTAALTIGYKFAVSQSTGNDGLYTVLSTTFGGTNTIITTNEAIVNPTVDGRITGGVYTIDFTDTLAKPPLDIVPHETNNTLSVTIPGRGSLNYGEKLIENMVHMLEHFASDTSPVNATIGQLWFDTSADALKQLTSTGWALTSGGSINLEDLVNVSNAAALNGQVLTYNVGTSMWEPLTPTPAAHTHVIGDLTDWPVLVSATEVGYLNGVTADIQPQLNGKALSIHTHLTSDITGLDTALSNKAPLASPSLTGVPTAPTAAPGTTSNQLATTAFALANVGSHTHTGVYEPANTNIQTHIGDGTIHFTMGSISITESQISDLQSYSLATHNHAGVYEPVDNTILRSADLGVTVSPLASPSLTGTPTAPTATPGTSTTQLATTAFVQAAIQTVGYKHTQGTAAAVWNIAHNLGTTFVSPTVFISGGPLLTQMIPSSVEIVDANTITITFSAVQSGQATIIGVL